MITTEARDKFNILQANGYENGKIKIINTMKNTTSFASSAASKKDEMSETFFAHVGQVTSLSFGSINEIPYLASTGIDGKLLLWNFLDGYWEYETIYESKAQLTSVSFSHSSSLIAAANNESTVIIFDLKNINKIVKKLEIKLDSITNQQTGFGNPFNPFGKTPNNYNIEGAQKNEITQVSFMPRSNEHILTILSTGEGRIYDISKEKEQFIQNSNFFISKSYVSFISVTFNYVAAICFDNIVRVFDFRTKSLDEIKITPPENVPEDKIHFYNENPIYSLFWKEYQNRLVINVQNHFTPPIDDNTDSSTYTYINPDLSATQHIYMQEPTGVWVKVAEQNENVPI
ncbi:hypothetical protein TRFO_02290 [Tritrichomonas foetus]|uniref:Uncharacterized protein n=1 Tax=Tritrichomonas foetus TaxID=1144522 RepID=A0A1J4J7U6_9EUKA|nr:hypothetical protein TRFO_02290 [Tritrichomonas foetus]|eukprot:OHS95278.1 hypothetical protein TRFO_02290 [Tritrichomonas foetus]